MVTRKGWFRSSLLLVLSLFLALASLSPALASGDDPRVLDPDSRPQGKSYGQWAGEWWQVFVQIPAPQNPIAGAPGCLIHMDGSIGLLVAGSGPQDCKSGKSAK